MKNKVKPIPDGYHAVTPYFVVKGAPAAIDFYKRAFGAKELFCMPGSDGKVMHAEITIGDSRIMLADECPPIGSRPGLSGTVNSIFLYVEDVDATFKQAIKAGGKENTPVQDMFWGDRYGKLTDPFGQRWALATHKEDLTPQEIEERATAVLSK